ncbi:MAG: lipopolysaccharide biosynthesis protein [Fermentimonas sp.]|jgi:teichuronic acid exporter
MADQTLKDKTTVSLFWSFIEKSGQQVVNLISGIILMRILDPSEYGLIGALTIFIAFSNILIDSGFIRALLNRKSISDAEYSTVFFFNLLLSVILYLLLYISAPFIADIFHEPRIEPISKVLFLSLIFSGFSMIQHTLLMKRGDFKGLSKVNISALIIAAIVAIYMSLNGYGVWALVMQSVTYSFTRSAFLWIYSKWVPMMSFNIKLLKSFIELSSKLLLTSIINAIFNNIYPSLIAYLYPHSMNQVGYYSQANKYQNIPFSILSDSFRSVSLLVLTEINNQSARIRRVLSKIMKSLAFLSFPIGMWLIIVAEALFVFLFKDKWLPAVPYFQILCIAGIVSPFTYILNELFISRNRADYYLGVEIARKIILVALIGLLLNKGVTGLAISWVLYTYITLIISLILSNKVIKYSVSSFLKDIYPYFIIATISTTFAYFATMNIDNKLIFIVLSGIIVVLIYYLLCRIFSLEMIKEMRHLINKKRTKI